MQHCYDLQFAKLIARNVLQLFAIYFVFIAIHNYTIVHMHSVVLCVEPVNEIAREVSRPCLPCYAYRLKGIDIS